MADENTSTSTSETGSEAKESATDTGRQETQTGQTGQGEEQLGDAGKKALQEERRKAKTAEKQLSEMQRKLQEYEDRDKTEAQRLADRADKAEKQAASATERLLRYEVAASKKLPSEWAARLQGSTQEELEADADALLEALGTQQQRQTPSYDGGVRQGAPATTDMNALIRQQAGRG